LKHIKRGRNKPTAPAKEAQVYAQVRLKNGVMEASHAKYLQAKKRARTGETILDGISLLDDNDKGRLKLMMIPSSPGLKSKSILLSNLLNNITLLPTIGWL
jgi:hypothetical protein